MYYKRNMLSMFKKDSDNFTIIVLSEELQTLCKETHKKVNKRRKCYTF